MGCEAFLLTPTVVSVLLTMCTAAWTRRCVHDRFGSGVGVGTRMPAVLTAAGGGVASDGSGVASLYACGMSVTSTGVGSGVGVGRGSCAIIVLTPLPGCGVRAGRRAGAGTRRCTGGATGAAAAIARAGAGAGA